MNYKEQKQYMDMLLELMKKNGINYLNFCIHGINNISELECLTSKQKGELGRKLGESIIQTFTEKDMK